MDDGEVSLFLTKLVSQAISPLALGIALVLAGTLLSLRHLTGAARVLIVSGIVLLWAASLAPVSVFAIATLESQYPPQPVADTPAADVAILLGGGVEAPVAPRIAAELNDGGDRVIHAARLYRAGKVGKILVTGGNLPWLAAGPSEAAHLRDYLVELGVPGEAIEIAGKSRNTIENAREIAALWGGGGYSSALLVTSAAHMPRAVEIFRRAGLPVTPSSTDVRGTPSIAFTPLELLPDADSLSRTTRAVKEWLGLLAVKIGAQR